MALRTGLYYTMPLGQNTQFTLSAGFLYASNIYIAQPVTVSEIACSSSAGVAGTQARMGIYRDNGGVPDQLVVDAGAVATTGGGVHSVFTSTPLTPGWYWLALAVQGGAGALTTAGVGDPRRGITGGIPTNAPGSIMELYSYVQTGITAALPSPWGATKLPFERMPVVWVAFSAAGAVTKPGEPPSEWPDEITPLPGGRP
jgi:hypothetical protein